MTEKLESAIDRTPGLSSILQWRTRRFDRDFDGNLSGAYRGIYGLYMEAAAAAAATWPRDCARIDSATLHRDQLDRVFPGEYPLLLWLAEAFRGGARSIFDLGGHVGVRYYSYRRLIPYPPDMTWEVYDVPAVVRSGYELARLRNQDGHLTFTDRFGQCDGSDILLTSGCLQYLEDTLADMLWSMQRRPKWILINLLPLHERHTFWTLRSIGQGFCPYHIQRAEEFFADLSRLGYRLLSRWDNPEKSCEIEFEPRYSVDMYAGAALKMA